MTASAEDLSLGADFAAVTAGQWQRLALAALRKSGGADAGTGPEQVEDLLATVTPDGLRVEALHTAENAVGTPTGLPGQYPYVRGATAAGALIAGWDVRQLYTDPEPKDVRDAALSDLENGTTSLWLTVGGEALPVEALPEALDGIHLDLAGVSLDGGASTTAAADAFFGLLAARGVAPSRACGGLGADPLGRRARTGDAGGLAGALRDAAALAGRCVAEAPGLRAITVDGTVFHDAGGSEAEELGCAVAAGVAYLRALTEAGLPVRAALDQMEFRFAATSDQFATIAKLRAGRRVWARVAEMCGAAESGGQHQHAVTSAVMMTARDPWVNLLRTTIACFAAGVGGADAVTVLPFDHALARPDGRSRRLARNTHALLVEEAQVARVLDPAGGSWYVERCTEQLAQAAWQWFTTVERAGGLAAALDSGLVADRLARTWSARQDGLAHGRNPITGVSEFPDLAEQPLPSRRAPAPPAGGLPRHTYAESFERLRDRSDAYLAATGRRPTVFLATLGPGAASAARVTFVTNLLAAGGISVTTGSADDPQAIVAAVGTGGTAVACLCGTDQAYAEQALPVAAALRAAGVHRVLLAGRGDFAGADRLLSAGGDAVAALTTTLDDLGVPQ